MSRCLYMAKWKLNCWIVPSPERPIFTSFLLCWQKKDGRRTEPEKYKTRKKNLCHWICPTADENARVTSPCRAALTYRCVDLSHSLQLSIKQHTHTSHKTETIFDHLLNVLNIRRAILPRCWPKFSVRRAATRRQNKHGRVCVFYSQPSHPLWMNEWAAKRLVVCDPAEWCYASKSFSLKRK